MAMAFLDFRLPAIGLTLFVTTLSCVLARAEKQPDFSLSGPPQTHAARQYAVGDLVPSSAKLDDDGLPN